MIRGRRFVALMIASLCWNSSLLSAEPAVNVRGTIIDAQTRKPLAARVYVRSPDGKWHFASSATKQGRAVEYRKDRGGSVEMNTSVSADPFVLRLTPGKYTLGVERGKEYVPLEVPLEVGNAPQQVTLRLERWIDMASRGWYSGDTHVHQPLDVLPTLMQAEDLNVAFPLTSWVTVTGKTPSEGRRSEAVQNGQIHLDATHVIHPRNTEYEIFSVGAKRHTLGAVFVLNQKEPLELSVPTVAPVAAEARRQKALLDLDKHSWPWSLMIVPIMNVDLFELSNNHVWRTKFGFPQWTIEMKPQSLGIETTEAGWTEWGWIDFGFKTYYALLNCGYRMRPTAGTATGVHPVPLGFGRVYVHLPDGFSYDKWVAGLDAGRSFVTTGPVLFVQSNGRPPGHTFQLEQGTETTCRVTGEADSRLPLDRIEILVNGEVWKRVKPANATTDRGSYRSKIDVSVPIDGTSWAAVRCFERHPEGRIRFAHSSPVWFDVPGRPLYPRKAEIRYLVRRMQEEIARNEGVLSKAAVDEYREALEGYQRLAKKAR